MHNHKPGVKANVDLCLYLDIMSNILFVC